MIKYMNNGGGLHSFSSLNTTAPMLGSDGKHTHSISSSGAHNHTVNISENIASDATESHSHTPGFPAYYYVVAWRREQ